MKKLDVGVLLDEGPFSRYQKLLIAGTALAVVLDGVDNQLLPNAVPAMMAEWQQPRAAFATAAAAGPFGMMIGGVIGGLLGDRYGRRTALVGSVLSFAALTLAIAFVDSLATLTAVRFLAGIGLGGAMPNAAALASEYVPRRQRPFAITLTIVCIPLGGFIAGLFAGQIVPTYGWRLLFAAGGIVPIVVSLVLFRVLPESPRYLVAHPTRWPELRATLRRLGHAISDDAEPVETGTPASSRTDATAAAAAAGAATVAATAGAASAAGTAPASARRVSIADLFAPELRRDTCALIGAFSSCLLAIYVGFLWIPAMLTDPQIGFSQAQGSYALGVFNVGGVVGALTGALVIQRLGSRVALLGMSGLAVVSAAIMAGMTLETSRIVSVLVMFAITGGLLNAVQTTMYALAAHVYPTAIRGTGVGTTVAVGRVGNVLASYVGSWALTVGGASLYFSTWAIAMAIVFVSLALVRRHIPRTVAAVGAVAVGASRSA